MPPSIEELLQNLPTLMARFIPGQHGMSDHLSLRLHPVVLFLVPKSKPGWQWLLVAPKQ